MWPLLSIWTSYPRMGSVARSAGGGWLPSTSDQSSRLGTQQQEVRKARVRMGMTVLVIVKLHPKRLSLSVASCHLRDLLNSLSIGGVFALSSCSGT